MSVSGLLLAAGLFLPATEICYPGGLFGPSSPGRCAPLSGWVSLAGVAAGALAIVTVAAAWAPLQYRLSRLMLAAGIVLLVTTLGLQLVDSPSDLRYGFWICCGCAAVLPVLAGMDLGRPGLELDGRLAAVVVCLVYLAVVVLPWWSVWALDGIRWAFWFAPFSWLTISGVLLCLALMFLWLEPPASKGFLTLLPTAMAALAAVDLARFEEVTWGGGIVLGLCGLLVLFARLEETLALGKLRVPEILRVDRL